MPLQLTGSASSVSEDPLFIAQLHKASLTQCQAPLRLQLIRVEIELKYHQPLKSVSSVFRRTASCFFTR